MYPKKPLSPKEKIIGTLLPISALRTKQHPYLSFGTITDGLVFLDWLEKTGQNAWQMLPLHETQLVKDSTTEHVPSPYKCYGIGLDPRHLLEEATRVPNDAEREAFLETHTDWLPDYVLFCALRDHFQTDDWTQWESSIRLREGDALEKYKQMLAKEIQTYVDEQWNVHRRYALLREKAKEKNIVLMGDLPFYLPLQSPLVWMNQHLFQLDEKGIMTKMSGVVNETESKYGRQVWGHPLYRWDDPTIHDEILTLFKKRLQYLSLLFDSVRLDHANGFFLYGSLDIEDASKDEKLTGPGLPFLEQIFEYCKTIGLELFVEDTASELKYLREAMQKLDVSGMKILRYLYDEKKDMFHNDYANPSTYPAHCVAYTTTHDTETLMGYLQSLTREQKQRVAQHVGVSFDEDDKKLAVAIRNEVMQSPSHTVIIPFQDWILSTSRINIPGTEKEKGDTNWQYRIELPVEELPHEL